MRASKIFATTLASVGLFAILPASAAAGLTFRSCGAGLECAQLTVPAHRPSPSPTIAISVERRKSVLGAPQSPTAVLALAGGPGQAALPYVSGFRQLIEPALQGRDLLVIDQRGTGSSAPLHCRAAEGRGSGDELEQYEQCARESHEQGSFTTEESVEDIEALRQATGYSKLVLYGTSYGTKVALNYAEAHPEHVESMLLDSVVPPEGEEALHVHSFSAVRGMLDELCRGSYRFAPHPVSEMAAFNLRWANRPLTGTYVDGRGRHHAISISETGLWSLLAAGDLNPVLRAMVPGAIHAALHGDSAPILHLWALANGLIPSGAGGGEGEGINTVLFLTTLCEDSTFPWNPAASYRGRFEEAAAAMFAAPGAAFYPFSAGAALATGIIPDCAAWPSAGSAPTGPPVQLSIPTLILSGGQDLRTPTVDARAVAARIQGAQLLVVPYVGHSVLGADLSGCASRAVAEFFHGYRVGRCTSTRRIVPPAAAPNSLRALRGRTRAAKTLAAVASTLTALRYDIAGSSLSGSLGIGARFGGIRGGYAEYGAITALHSYSDVPGVTLTGNLRSGRGGVLRIRGRSGAHGSLHVTNTRIYGTLAGRRVRIALPGSRAFLTALGSEAQLPTRLPGPVLP